MNTITINEVQDDSSSESTIETQAVDIAILLKEYGTKSAVIRELHSRGWKRGAIAKAFVPPLRYQHVRNVLTQPAPKRRELL